ncbi:sugar porter family MFS transporter [Streptomyces montanisoli]|uniref:Sugar porter family MFS transporter n=1 Tax=Streptomyces montanisoli TaxID=2798581 RepID=A0A940M9S8_9ACTN|nr:sugar porter family MFS transporter [Streptomyces montanisoli]MBP0458924.1 sugar porter family MFS transporter [Streptomyces montanisoli]
MSRTAATDTAARGTQPAGAGRPLGTKVAVVAAALGLIYGYDSGSISGALVFLKKDYDLSTLWVSVITSIVVFGSLVGAAMGPKAANRLGRKLTMILVAGGFAVFAALSAVPLGVWWLTGVRLLLGVTIGLSTVVAPVFISEFASEHNRGRLGTAYQFFTCAGVIVSLVVAWALSGGGSWEALLGISAVPAAVVLLALLRFPDSPRWYAMRGRYDEARATLVRVEPESDTDAQLASIRADLAQGEQGTFREIFTRRYARATFFVIAFGFFVQITGTNTILYYSPLIFDKAGIADASESILLSALVQLVAAVGVVLSMLVVDRWGRRPPLLIGTVAMVVGHLVMALVFARHTITPGAGYAAVAGIGIFYLGFYFGIGSLIWVYTGEAFPARLRSVGAAALLLSDFVANLIATFAFPGVLSDLGGSVGFGAFGVLSLLALAFLYRMAPETRGRSLEEIRGYWDNGGHWPAASPGGQG